MAVTTSTERRIISNHRLHPDHSLLKVPDGDDFLCGLCLSDGSAARYRCDHCNFNLHPFCAICPEEVLSPFHTEHALKLVPGYKCHACGEPLPAKDLGYACDPCSSYLHISCLHNLYTPLSSFPKQIKHELHAHQLEIEEKPRAFTCDKCKNTGSGKRYTCKSHRISSCQFHLHTYCALDPEPSVRPPSHTQHELKLGCWAVEHSCASGDGKVGGEFYMCKACGFVLHPTCHEKSASPVVRQDDNVGPQPETVRERRPEGEGVRSIGFFMHPQHRLTLRQARRGSCEVCNGAAEEGKRWYACGGGCEFYVHEGCCSLEPAIIDKIHSSHLLHYQRAKAGWCLLCDGGIRAGHWRYYCALCEVHLHRVCPPRASAEEEEAPPQPPEYELAPSAPPFHAFYPGLDAVW